MNTHARACPGCGEPVPMPANISEAMDDFREAAHTLLTAVDTMRVFIPHEHHATLDGYIADLRSRLLKPEPLAVAHA